MRLAASSLLLLCMGSMACTLPAPDFDGGYDEDDTARPIDPTRPTRPPPSPKPTTPPTSTTPTPPTAPPAPTSTHPEVVTVFTSDTAGNRWFCTGTLVSPTEVVTAAHCLDPAPKVTFSIVASQLSGKPRFAGLSARAYGGSYEDVANPDIGIITLAQPVVLPRYAELADVTAEVDAGGVRAKAYVRTAEQSDAPFVFTSEMPISSTAEYGYSAGFGTPMFSKGGDSGAGLFLVENGEVTHKLVAVARQPEPSRNLDHFTRIDSGFLAFRANR